MTLKKCSQDHIITTKNAKRVIRDPLGVHFNCPECSTTVLIKDKKFSIKTEYFQRVIRKEA